MKKRRKTIWLTWRERVRIDNNCAMVKTEILVNAWQFWFTFNSICFFVLCFSFRNTNGISPLTDIFYTHIKSFFLNKLCKQKLSFWWKRHTIILSIIFSWLIKWSRVWHFCFIISHIWWHETLGALCCKPNTHTQYAIKQTIYTDWVRADFCQNEMLAAKKNDTPKNFYAIFANTFHNHVRGEHRTPATFLRNTCCWKIKISIAILRFGVYQPKMCTSPSHAQQVRASQKGAIIVRQQNRFKWSLY